jgi:hypothetical protein
LSEALSLAGQSAPLLSSLYSILSLFSLGGK